MNEIITARDIEIVTAEIVTIKRQAQQVLITAAIEIGRRLTEAKSMVPHGEWGRYLEERVEYSQSTANNLMKIYKEYGTGQDSLFDGFANSQTFANLNYTQALALLSVPAEEREQFAVENDVGNKSTREIQELIRQRDEALTAKEGAEAALAEAQDMVDTAADKLAEKDSRLKFAEAAVVDREKEAADLRSMLEKSREAEKKAKAQLKEARENPVVSEDQMAKIRKEAEEAAAAQAAENAAKEVKKLQAKLEKAQSAADKAAREKEQAQFEAEEARQKMKAAQAETRLANPDAAVFKTLFEQVQDTFNRMNGVRLKIAQTDPAMAAKFVAATKAVLDRWAASLEGDGQE